MAAPTDSEVTPAAQCESLTLRVSAEALGRSLCSVGIQAIALLLGLALAFM